MTNPVGERLGRDDLRRVAAVAADFAMLQGLINVTTGIGLVLWALVQPAIGSVVMAAGVAVWTTYYQRRFGRVVGRGSLLVSVVVVLAALAVCLVGFVVDGLVGHPVLVLPLIAAVCLAVTYRVGYRHVGVTWLHWLVVGLLALVSLAPLVGLGALGARTGVLALGVAMIVVGVADHVRLVRAMKPVPRD